LFTKAFFILALCGVSAQTDQPAFEVASVRPNHSGSGNSSTNASKGRITIENESLKQLIERAYNVRDFSFSGPAWLDTERFDIAAKPPEGTPPSQILPMLQTLLVERFQLAVHRKQEKKSGYALILAKPDTKLEQAPAGQSSSTSSGRGTMKAAATTMAYFADMLSRELNQPVQDKTGLTGAYNLKLDWSPDPATSDTAKDLPSGPSLFTALQEQLGLKLRPQKVEVEVLVVDSAQKVPAEN
jgi:uncharacterized protein (TIGR03435 family)